MLFGGCDLAEGLASAQRLEHRIIAETLGPARRPDDDAVHPAFEAFDMAIGPGKRQCADEMGVVARFRPGALHRFMDKPHGKAEGLALARPARRTDAGIAAKRLDAQAAVIGKRPEERRVGKECVRQCSSQWSL